MTSENLNQWNEKTFKEYYSRYYKILVLYALKLTSDEAVAKDIVQDVFFNLWKMQKVFSCEAQMRSYLYTSVHNKALDDLKHQTVKQEFINKSRETGSTYHVGEDGTEDFFSEEVFRRLFELIDSLPTRQRAVFVRLIEGKKLREIAAEMDLSIETVKTHKDRGLQTLRRHMNPNSLSILLIMIN